MNWRLRFKAAGVHLALSMAVAAAVAALVLAGWFPAPYRDISGGWALFGLIVAVDVTLGPLLTLAVFNLKKPRRELVRDLTLIGALQLAALGYGLWSLSLARPVALVYEVDRFKVVTRAELSDEDLSRAAPPYSTLSWWGVPVHGVRLAKDGPERLADIESALQGKDISAMPWRWQPLADNADYLRKMARPYTQVWAQANAQEQARMSAALQQSGWSADEVLTLPVLGRSTRTWLALIETRQFKQVVFVDVDGFVLADRR